MPYITPGDRHQIQMITLDSMLEPESEVRIIDAFVNALDLNKLGFARTVPAKEGRPAYDPRSLMKLYIYGVQNDIRSSRKLEKVEGEFALLVLGYNIRRAYNHFGFKKLMDLISKKSDAFYSVFKVHLLKRHETPRIVYTTSKIGFFGILEYSV